MPASLSAIDAIGPAFDRARRQLFQTFRFAFWARMALIALATGEFYSSSGWGGFHFTMPSSRRHPGYLVQSLVQPHWEYLKRYLPWFILGVLVLFALMFLWAYIASVFRFVLFDSVLTDRCAIRAQWRHWAPQGFRFFLWKICFELGVLLALGVLAGAVILALVTSGAYRDPRHHLALLVLGGLLAFLLLAGLIIAAALIDLFARDFLVPVMALENVGIIDGWWRVMALLGVEKKAYLGYVLMKAVLVVGSTIIFGIRTLIAVVLLFIPISIVGVGAYFFAKSQGLLWSMPAIVFAIILAAMALAVIVYVTALISAPAMVFFQAYVIDFLGSRYLELGVRLSAPSTLPYIPDSGIVPAG